MKSKDTQNTDQQRKTARLRIENRNALETALISFYQREHGPSSIPIGHIERMAEYLMEIIPDDISLGQKSELTPGQIYHWMHTGKIPEKPTDVPGIPEAAKHTKNAQHSTENKIPKRDKILSAIIIIGILILLFA